MDLRLNFCVLTSMESLHVYSCIVCITQDGLSLFWYLVKLVPKICVRVSTQSYSFIVMLFTYLY